MIDSFLATGQRRLSLHFWHPSFWHIFLLLRVSSSAIWRHCKMSFKIQCTLCKHCPILLLHRTFQQVLLFGICVSFGGSAYSRILEMDICIAYSLPRNASGKASQCSVYILFWCATCTEMSLSKLYIPRSSSNSSSHQSIELLKKALL